MKYQGWAFKNNSDELYKNEVGNRYQEIKHLINEIKITKNPQYGKTSFVITPLTDATKQLSEMDMLILADNGNLCFGGYCDKNSNGSFSGAYYVD